MAPVCKQDLEKDKNRKKINEILPTGWVFSCTKCGVARMINGIRVILWVIIGVIMCMCRHAHMHTHAYSLTENANSLVPKSAGNLILSHSFVRCCLFFISNRTKIQGQYCTYKTETYIFSLASRTFRPVTGRNLHHGENISPGSGKNVPLSR